MAVTNPVPPSNHSSDGALLAGLDVLVVDGSPQAGRYADVLRPLCRTVTLTPHQRTALQFMERINPALVVAALRLEDGSGVEICRTAKAKPTPPSVLITAENVDDVPDALIAGCESILLKPFSPSILVNRASRMLRLRSEQLRLRSARTMIRAEHLRERSELLKMGINRDWPAVSCPYCSHQGVTSFDYTSSRRAWYACLRCRKVWMGKRLDT
jgi:CheY-like chemotaxis protein